MARVWIGNFKGAKGDQGDKGDVGPQGPRGEQGPMGLVNGEAAIEFEDYEAEGIEVPEPDTALAEIASGKSLKGVISNIKAFLKGVRYATGILYNLGTKEEPNYSDLQTVIQALNVKMDYVSITNKITFDDTKCAITNAYVENGVVVILFSIKKDFSGGVNGIFTVPPEYAPRSVIYATHWNATSSGDFNKINSILLNIQGTCDVWMREKLEYGEPAQFIYPLKSEN